MILKDKPWVLDITSKFQHKLDKFDGNVEKLKEFYKKFGFDAIPYDGIHRWGLDSSTESSDITCHMLEVGHCLYWRKYTENGYRWVKVRVTHIFNGIIFFETIGEKKEKSFYLDTGADDYEWADGAMSRYSLPKHRFYPMEVIKPEWVDISSWNAPKKMKIINKE